MNRVPRGTAAAAALIFIGSALAFATPSTTYWTACTLDFQPPEYTHITYDNYSTVGSQAVGSGGEQFPTDYGLTWGHSLGGKLAVEYGFDYLTPSDHPWFFNAKVGFPEGTLSRNAPAVELGFFNFGTKSGITNQNIVHLLVGKTLPKGLGRLSASYYVGNSNALRSSTGKKENTGFMVAYDRPLIADRIVLAADYASGDNAIGGGGVGLYFYFNKNVDLLVGPVWFNDKGINGKTKWTVQLDINF